jgi:oxygen-independent coproporphyrinogen-3 oxidase
MTTANNKVCFDQDLIERYGGRGPRYTSYPTALQFDEGFTASDYERVASHSNLSGRPLSVYVHIPFCRSLCYYCACNKIVTRNAERVAKYLASLEHEIDLQSRLFDETRLVEQLHFGGGTPTYLNRKQMWALMADLRQAFTFDESDRREFSIEVDPRAVRRNTIAELADLGFNRLSLGVQDFDPRVQKAVNRMQTVEQVCKLVADANESGFRSVSFDLIYGLPHQTVQSFDRTLELVLAIRPERLAIYNYAHLPARFKGQRMINEADIPSPQEKLNIFHHTIDKLGNSDYQYIGMDHFALPDDDLVAAKKSGTLQRNFQGYSTHAECDLIGLGVSAIGRIGDAYAQNSTSTSEYESELARDVLPIKRGIEVDRDDCLRADVIQRLMCHDGLRIEDFENTHGISFRKYFQSELRDLAPLVEDGLVSVDDNDIEISEKGRLLVRNVAMVFDRHLNGDGDNNRFSKAI